MMRKNSSGESLQPTPKQSYYSYKLGRRGRRREDGNSLGDYKATLLYNPLHYITFTSLYVAPHYNMASLHHTPLLRSTTYVTWILYIPTWPNHGTSKI